MIYLSSFKLCDEILTNPNIYPHNVFRNKDMPTLFFSPVTVLYGNNGSGKPTILNIIANLVVAGKTVQVVSNNNSAIENVLEKLSDPQYQLDFIVAKLGKSENKRDFLDYQTGSYPDFSTWNSSTDQILLKNEIDRDINLLKGVFDAQERVAV